MVIHITRRIKQRRLKDMAEYLGLVHRFEDGVFWLDINRLESECDEMYRTRYLFIRKVIEMKCDVKLPTFYKLMYIYDEAFTLSL